MLDRSAVLMPRRSPDGVAAARALGSRRRAFVACTVLVFALHLTLLYGVGDRTGGSPDSGAAAMSVRSIVLGSAPETEKAGEVAVAPSPPAPPPVREPPSPRRQRSPQPSPIGSPPVARVEAGASSAGGQQLASTAGSASRPTATLGGVEEGPPPVYRTQLPAPATIRYQVRRGGLRGDAEIRWQPSGDRYRLALEARIGSLTLLVQTSEGAVDANGLAPVRFVDQRARRSAQAANFVRDAGRITFSGTGVESPLVAGSQDRLSWMIQLAGIAAAEPQLLVEGGQIAMVVVGARGDASVWVLRSAGHDDIETAHGTVHAIKLLRQGRSAYDTTAEIWLDPERSYLPARATLRNDAGTSEYDLLLERVDPTP
jgi:hypothetical protein